MKKILCIGSVTTDVIVTPADSIPAPGSLRAVDNVATCTGGCAVNAAIDLGKMGYHPMLSCKVGDDAFGKFVTDSARAVGVDTRGVVVDSSVSTTVSVVCVNSSGERSFLYNPGSAAQFKAEDVPDALLEEADIVFVAGTNLLTSFDGKPCAEVLKKARAMGKYTVLDTAWDFEDLWLPKVADAIPLLDLFMPSIEEAQKISGLTEKEEIAEKFIQMGAKNVIIKIGKDGAYVRQADGECYVVPTYRKYKPVDTTGAGDSFCAGFLGALSEGKSFRESAQFANAVGTHCIMGVGASTGIKTKSEILKFMQENEL